jgi:hypothetical protein
LSEIFIPEKLDPVSHPRTNKCPAVGVMTDVDPHPPDVVEVETAWMNVRGDPPPPAAVPELIVMVPPPGPK